MITDEVSFFKLLADETRIKILKFLLNGERCVCEIFPMTKKTQSTTSIHLNKLESAGILKSRKEGRKVFYSIADKRIFSILTPPKKWEINFSRRVEC